MAALFRYRAVATLLVFQPGILLSLADRPGSVRNRHPINDNHRDKLEHEKNLAISGTLIQVCLLMIVCGGCVFGMLRKFPDLHGVEVAQSGSILFLFFLCSALIHHFTWDLADAVTDFGNSFLIRRRGKVLSVALEEIAWVGFSVQRPPLVTFRFYHANVFGKEISFIPAGDTWQILLENKSAIADGINHRIVEAKDLN